MKSAGRKIWPHKPAQGDDGCSRLASQWAGALAAGKQNRQTVGGRLCWVVVGNLKKRLRRDRLKPAHHGVHLRRPLRGNVSVEHHDQAYHERQKDAVLEREAEQLAFFFAGH